MLSHWAPYRVLRVALTVCWILPQYWILTWRSKWPRLAADQDGWDRVHARAARALRALGLGLAGMFVKLCQVVGARADVFPRPFIDELSRFHDRVPARPFSALRASVERDMKRSVEEVFESVTSEPIAAASLAQVHRVKLADGRDAVIKVQYPEVARLARIDLKSLRRVAKLAGRLQKRLDLGSLVEEVAKFIALELDFVREGESTESVRKAFGDSEDVRVPRVFTDVSTAHVLVLEYFDGIRVTDFDALERAGHDRRVIAERIARIYATMIFEHGFFHGDPHPGNLLVLPDGKIGLLDFGLAKRLPQGFAAGVARMLTCAFTRDGAGITREARALGFQIDDADPDAVGQLAGLLIGEKSDDVNVLDVLSKTSVGKIPEDFGLIVRALILLNGLSHSLAPGERVIQHEMARAISAVLLKSAASAAA